MYYLVHGSLQQLQTEHDYQHRDEQSRQIFYAGMPVRVVLVFRYGSQPESDQRHH